MLGLAVLRLPRYLHCDQLKRGVLVELMPDLQLPAKLIPLAYPARKHVPMRSRVF